MILTLQTTSFGAQGGIPTYNRVVNRSLNAFEVLEKSTVLIATDTPADLKLNGRGVSNLNVIAFSGNRAAFVRKVLMMGLTRRIDLLLVGHINYAPLGFLLKVLQPGLRYGVMVHGIDVWTRLPWFKRWSLQRADFVTSVSEYTKKQVELVNGVPSARVHLLPNAIEWIDSPPENNSQDERSDQLKSTTGPMRLLSVCRLDQKEQYKGVDTVIEALPLVVKSGTDVHYFVIGAGTDLKRHERLATENGVNDRVHFLGSVDEATLRQHYSECDIFVLPSTGEGFGIVYLEAMRYAKPIIAANCTAVPEVVSHDHSGLLVDAKNVRDVADAIIKLCGDRKLREEMGRTGYETLQRNFTYDQFRSRFNEILIQQLPGKVLPGVAKLRPSVSAKLD